MPHIKEINHGWTQMNTDARKKICIYLCASVVSLNPTVSLTAYIGLSCDSWYVRTDSSASKPIRKNCTDMASITIVMIGSGVKMNDVPRNLSATAHTPAIIEMKKAIIPNAPKT